MSRAQDAQERRFTGCTVCRERRTRKSDDLHGRNVMICVPDTNSRRFRRIISTYIHGGRMLQERRC